MWFWKLFGWKRRAKYQRVIWYRGADLEKDSVMDWVNLARPDDPPAEMVFDITQS